MQAPKGKFRVIGVDLNEGAAANYHLGDFETFSSADQLATERASVGIPIYVFDDAGRLLVRHGSWH